MRSKPASGRSVPRSNFDAIRLHIEYMAPRQVRLPRRRVRKHSKAQIREFTAGIDRHGFNVPLLIDENFMLVSGQARLDAAELLGLAEVPVIQLAHLTPEQLRLFSIFENKIAEKSEWDEEALTLEFDELSMSGCEIELTDSGFAIGEIDAMASRIRTSALDDLSGVYQPDPKRPVVTRVGDTWLCGRHRIVCGDSTDAAVIACLVGEQRIRQVIGDLPYNLPTRTFSSSGRHSDFAAGAGEMSDEEFIAFIARATEALKPVLIDGALIYYFMDYRHIAELIAGGRVSGLSYKQLLV
jgi:hypothetical protein